MKKVIVEFTLNGRKHTYYRRTDIFGKPLTTTNINSAKWIKENDTKKIVGLILKEWGKNNVKDINIIKEGEEK